MGHGSTSSPAAPSPCAADRRSSRRRERSVELARHHGAQGTVSPCPCGHRAVLCHDRIKRVIHARERRPQLCQDPPRHQDDATPVCACVSDRGEHLQRRAVRPGERAVEVNRRRAEVPARHNELAVIPQPSTRPRPGQGRGSSQIGRWLIPSVGTLSPFSTTVRVTGPEHRVRPQRAGPKLPRYPGNGEVSGSQPSVAALGAAQVGAQAPALARVLAGAMVAAAAWVLAAAPAAPAAVRAVAMAAAAAAEASESAAAAAVWAVAVPARQGSQVLRTRTRDLLAPGHDSPAGCRPPSRRSLARRLSMVAFSP
jgi:hypothetical protein